MDIERVKRVRGIRLVVAVNDRYGADSGGYLASAIAYYGFFSVLSLSALALSVVGFALAGDPGQQQRFVDSVTDAIPGIGGFLQGQIHSVVETRFLSLAIGLAGLLFTGTGAVNAAGWALGRVFRVPEMTGFVKKKLWSLGSLVLLGVIVIASGGIVGVVQGLHATGWAAFGLWVAGLLVSFAFDVGLFLVAYRILLQRRGPAWRQVLPGSVFGAFGWTALKLAGTWYVTRAVAGATAVYGTFGTVVGILGLLYLASRVFLYGAELNAVLIEERGKAPVEEAIEPGGASLARDRQPTTASSNGNGTAPDSGLTDTRSTPQLIKDIAGDTATLVRKEVELARQEVVEALVARAKAAGALAGAGVMALFMLVFLGIAGGLALATVMAAWAAFLIVAGAFLLLALGAALFAKLRLKTPPLAPEETKRTVKEDVEWAKAQLRR
jgi:YihY family inner membrane protein